MPAARYWRAVGLQSVGGGALELSALHLYLGGVRVDAAATLTSAIAPAGGSLAALQDDDTATTARWLDVSAPGFALVWDFGAGGAQDVLAVRLGSGALYAEWLETLTLQYSSDGVVWVTQRSIPTFSWPGANVLQGVPAVEDPYWDRVVALLHFDGDLTDETGRVWASSGQATIDSSQAVIGSGCLHLAPGRPRAFLDSVGPEWAFGTGDFTLEAYTQLPSLGREATLWDFRPDSTNGNHILVSTRPNGGIYVYVNSAYIIDVTTAVWVPGVWTHVALVRESGQLRLYIAGELRGSATNSADLQSPRCKLGGNNNIYSSTEYDWDGYIDEVRITKGVARYTANFTPPAEPFPGAASGLVVQRKLGVKQSAPPIFLSGGSAGDTIPVLPPATIHLDRQDANGTETNAPATRYRIPGPRWVKEKTASTNVPLRRRVQLYNQRDSRLVREVWSDPVTGEYSFDNIRGDTTYFVIAFDHTGHYRAVIADNLTPEPIP